MNAVEALAAAQAAGVSVRIDGDDLVLEASAAPPSSVLDLLAHHKVSILSLLREADRGWSAEDWQAFFDERAAIAEFDGGLPRPVAEASAFACCMTEWLNHNPVSSLQDRCLGCGGGEQGGDTLLPYGSDRIGYAWLHSRCWPGWHELRNAEAAAMLAGMGVEPRDQGRIGISYDPSGGACDPEQAERLQGRG